MEIEHTLFFSGIRFIPPEHSEQQDKLCELCYAFLESPLPPFSFQQLLLPLPRLPMKLLEKRPSIVTTLSHSLLQLAALTAALLAVCFQAPCVAPELLPRLSKGTLKSLPFITKTHSSFLLLRCKLLSQNLAKLNYN